MYIPAIFEQSINDWRAHLGGAYLPDESLYFFHCLRALCHMAQSPVIKIDHISRATLSELVHLGEADESKYAPQIRAVIKGESPDDRRWVPALYKELCEDQGVDPEYNMYLLNSLMEGCITQTMADSHLDIIDEIRDFQNDNEADYREPTAYSSTIVMVYMVDMFNLAVHQDLVSTADIKKLSGDYNLGLKIIPNVASDEGILSEDTNFIILRPVVVEDLYPLMGLE